MLSSLEQDANYSINISSLFPDINYMLLKPQHEIVLQDLLLGVYQIKGKLYILCTRVIILLVKD